LVTGKTRLVLRIADAGLGLGLTGLGLGLELTGLGLDFTGLGYNTGQINNVTNRLGTRNTPDNVLAKVPTKLLRNSFERQRVMYIKLPG